MRDRRPGNLWRLAAAATIAALTAAMTWRDRDRGRRRLAEMSSRELADIGVTRQEARREAKKPFWQP